MSLWVPKRSHSVARERNEKERDCFSFMALHSESNFNPLLQAHMCVSTPHLWAFSYVNRLLFTWNLIINASISCSYNQIQFSVVKMRWETAISHWMSPLCVLMWTFLSLYLNYSKAVKHRKARDLDQHTWNRRSSPWMNALDSNGNIVLNGKHNNNNAK